MPPQTPSASILAGFFFTSVSASHYTCNVCANGKTYSQAHAKGYSNLMTHLRAVHPTYPDLYQAALDAAPGTLTDFGFVSNRATGLAKWLALICFGNLPISIVENELFRQCSSLPKTTYKTVRKTMHSVELAVVDKITEVFPPLFGLIIDAWTSGGTTFCGVFASFHDPKTDTVNTPLLGFSPVGDSTSWSANAYIDFLAGILEIYNKSFSSIGFVVGDNCATNQSIGRKLGLPLVGCASHRLNLSIQAYLQQYEPIINKVNQIMVKLRTGKIRGALFKLTSYTAKIKNATRWSSIFVMLSRYFVLVEFLSKIDEIADMLPTRAQHKKLEALHVKCEEFYGYTLALQSEDITMYETRLLLDRLISRYPDMAHHLAPDAEIVQCVAFESAVVKVQAGNALQLSEDERVALEPFVHASDMGDLDTSEDEVENPRLFALNFLKTKRQCLATPPASDAYINLKCVLPTSNLVERLFSKAKLVHTDRRMRMTPETLQGIIFLAANKTYWDATTVEVVLRRNPEADE